MLREREKKKNIDARCIYFFKNQEHVYRKFQCACAKKRRLCGKGANAALTINVVLSVIYGDAQTNSSISKLYVNVANHHNRTWCMVQTCCLNRFGFIKFL